MSELAQIRDTRSSLRLEHESERSGGSRQSR
jgi:hypothetical protein